MSSELRNNLVMNLKEDQNSVNILIRKELIKCLKHRLTMDIFFYMTYRCIENLYKCVEIERMNERSLQFFPKIINKYDT